MVPVRDVLATGDRSIISLSWLQTRKRRRAEKKQVKKEGKRKVKLQKQTAGSGGQRFA
jgi:hypothetical protein